MGLGTMTPGPGLLAKLQTLISRFLGLSRSSAGAVVLTPAGASFGFTLSQSANVYTIDSPQTGQRNWAFGTGRDTFIAPLYRDSGNQWDLSVNGYRAGGSAGSRDVGLVRGAGGVWTLTDGAAGAGWLQNSAGEAALAGNFTNATATLNNTNLSRTVIAGRAYRIEALLIVSNTTAGEGVKFDFGGGAASATTFQLAATIVGTNTPGTVVSTTLTGAINFSSITSTCYIFVQGYLLANAGGTLILRAAENSHSTGTLTLAAGSWLGLHDTVNL